MDKSSSQFEFVLLDESSSSDRHPCKDDVRIIRETVKIQGFMIFAMESNE